MGRLVALFYRNAFKLNGKRAALLIFCGAVMIFVVGSMSFGMGEIGAAQAVPTMFYAANCFLTLMVAVPSAKSMLFGFRDYELQMSLPIPARTIAASRVAIFIVSEEVYAFALLLPAFAAYAWYLRPAPLWYVSALLLIITAPILPSVIGSVFGVLASLLTVRRGGKALQYITLMIVTLGVMVMNFSINRSFSNVSPENAANITNSMANVQSKFAPAALFANAADGNWAALLIFTVSSAAVFALFALVLGKVFGTLNSAMTAVKTGSKRKSNTSVNVSSGKSSVFGALLSKELRLLFGSPIYLMNSTFGMVMMLLVAAVVVIASPQKLLGWFGVPPEIIITNAQIAPFVPLVLALFPAMTSTSSVSISIEGKRLNHLLSLPVRATQIYIAKIAVNLIVVVPLTLIAAVMLAARLHMTGITLVLTLFSPLAFGCFMSVFGLAVNLLLPKLNWTSEQQAVKQSASPVISIFTGMFAMMIPFGISFAADPLVTVGVTTAIILALTAVITALIIRFGKNRLLSISS
jgi:ABC-2 type transport system permease protein